MPTFIDKPGPPPEAAAVIDACTLKTRGSGTALTVTLEPPVGVIAPG